MQHSSYFFYNRDEIENMRYSDGLIDSYIEREKEIDREREKDFVCMYEREIRFTNSLECVACRTSRARQAERQRVDQFIKVSCLVDNGGDCRF